MGQHTIVRVEHLNGTSIDYEFRDDGRCYWHEWVRDWDNLNLYQKKESSTLRLFAWQYIGQCITTPHAKWLRVTVFHGNNVRVLRAG
jgi:hypothetical protein